MPTKNRHLQNLSSSFIIFHHLSSPCIAHPATGRIWRISGYFQQHDATCRTCTTSQNRSFPFPSIPSRHLLWSHRQIIKALRIPGWCKGSKALEVNKTSHVGTVGTVGSVGSVASVSQSFSGSSYFVSGCQWMSMGIDQAARGHIVQITAWFEIVWSDLSLFNMVWHGLKVWNA